MDENAIELIGVSKSFKLQRWNPKNSTLGPEIIRPVDNISLTIKKQKMIGIIGKNGSGKTTLLRLISNIYQPDKGTIEINGKKGNTYTIKQGLARQSKVTPVCVFDKSKISGRAEFSFNVTAKEITTSGFRDLHVVNKDFLEQTLRKYDEVDENVIITNSLEFRDYVKGRKDLLSSFVGKNDLIQPIVVAGTIARLDLQDLLHGINSETTIPIALFINNNGNGFIDKVRTAHFITPRDIEFVEFEGTVKKEIVNCGLDSAKLSSISFNKLKKGAPTRIVSCNLGFTATFYPNTPEPKPINIELTYDYTISRKRTVIIQ